ncbi:MAG: hypothetical protein HY900_25360 [Deltaproteobacteria bacterium]|nr:hypothetical protein [Deltaproteobacteria bacterium]
MKLGWKLIALLSLVLSVMLSLAYARAPMAFRTDTLLPPRPVQFVNIVGPAGLEPFSELRLGRFTRVLWTNQAGVPVRIRLGSGQDCTEASATVMRVLDSQFLMRGCYVTEKALAAGGVLETAFHEAGRFAYEVEYVGGNARQAGKIVVY